MQILILIAGLAVYAGYGPAGLGYLLCAVAVSYWAGRMTPKYPWAAGCSVVIQVGMLLAFKLRLFDPSFFPAPLGLSYFTLQMIAYNVDVRRGKFPPERSLFRYGLCMTYLPKMYLGPIERYDRMNMALASGGKFTWNGISGGAARALWGLFKKLVIAARAGVVVSAISGDTTQYQGAYALAAMLLYSVQLYADFSGGMDLVLGVSQMLGVSLSENFDAPYFSQSVQEFWRRWHITLGSFLRDYVYIPLGGSRKGKLRKACNLIITFLVSGLWHGTQYLLWGVFHGLLVLGGEKFKTKWKTWNRLATFLLVSLLWAFFIWPDSLTALRMMASVFTSFNYAALFAGIGQLGLGAGEWAVLVIAVAVLWCCDVFRERLLGTFRRLSPAGRTAVLGALALTVLVFGMYGIGFHAEEFIYSRF